MPIYSFRCSVCGAEDEAVLSIENKDTSRLCECGSAMTRVVALSHFRMPKPGRERVLDTLNYEYNKPGLRSPRSTAALAHGLERVKPTIGIGFKEANND